MANVLVQESSLQDIADAIRTKNGTQNTYKPSQMADAIEAISGGGITPTGTINITTNGTHDVTSYASASVNVPTGSADLGTKTITANGTYDAEDDSLDGYSSVTVNVPSVAPTGTKQISITQNGTTTEDVTNYASAEITVNVPSSSLSWDDIASNSKPSGDVVLTGTSIASYAFAYRKGTNTWTVEGASVTTLGENAFRECTYLTSVKFPSLTSQHATGYTFYGCSRLALVDWGLCNVPGNTFVNCSSLKTLILRKSSAIQTCASTSVFNGTPFKSGGTGGTIYIPKALYDHLGDGSSLDYKSATNWATYDGYGTITWAQIEGSIYE